MRRTSSGISRRQFSKLLGVPLCGIATPWAIPLGGSAQSREAERRPEPIEARWTETQKREAQKALEAVEKESQTIGKFELATEVEPAFVFRALPFRVSPQGEPVRSRRAAI